MQRSSGSDYSSFQTFASIAASLTAGAALAYLLDPDRGRRRRSIARDKFEGSLNDLGSAMGKTYRDTRNRIQGAAHELHMRDDNPDDHQLEGRVRAALGRVVTHSRSVHTSVADGVVTLSGVIPSNEIDGLLSTVSSVRGVQKVINDLDAREAAGTTPGLQGSPRQSACNWPPATRALATVGGSGLLLWAISRRGAWGTLAGTAGAALLARGISNVPLADMVSGGSKSGAVVDKMITINAPVDQVFAFFSDYANFPKFMSHVKEVRMAGQDLSHWSVDAGPGLVVEFDSIQTQIVPNRLIAWETVEGSDVESAGELQFEEKNGRTSVRVRMAYNPPLGVLGHAAASIAGLDPKSQMDDDLMRAKSFLETGNAPRDGAQA